MDLVKKFWMDWDTRILLQSTKCFVNRGLTTRRSKVVAFYNEWFILFSLQLRMNSKSSCMPVVKNLHPESKRSLNLKGYESLRNHCYTGILKLEVVETLYKDSQMLRRTKLVSTKRESKPLFLRNSSFQVEGIAKTREAVTINVLLQKWNMTCLCIGPLIDHNGENQHTYLGLVLPF